MAARVNEAEVKDIIPTTLSDITPFITAANLTVTERLAETVTLSDDQLKEIERWFAAHLIAMSSKDLGARDTDAEGTLDAKVTYAGKTGKGLEATRYGQVVLSLDTTGRMASIGKKGLLFKAVTSFD